MEPTIRETLSDDVALVTGANRGIGREIARDLATLDATVYGGVRSEDRTVPDGVEPVVCDVTDEDGVAVAVEAIVDDAGGLDVLVNNAGVGGLDAGLADADPADLWRVLDVNLRGPMRVTRAALPHLLEEAGGRVVTLSSGVGVLSDPIESAMPAYRISKAGVDALTVSLDRTYGAEGLIANAADPGWVATDLGGDEAPRTPQEGAETPVWLARFAPGSPGGLLWKDREPIPF